MRCPPCFPSCPMLKAHPTTLDNGIWLLPGSWPLVINAQKLPLPARFIKLPVAGCRARDLAHQELNLPDKEQKLSPSQGHMLHIKGDYQRSESAEEPAAPARNGEGAVFGFPPSSQGLGVGGSQKRNRKLFHAVLFACLVTPSPTHPRPNRPCYSLPFLPPARPQQELKASTAPLINYTGSY